MSIALAGCAGSGSGVELGATAATSEECAATRQRLDALDAKGVVALVERSNNGAGLNAAQRADVESYNSLLAQYLGTHCHAAKPKTIFVSR